LDGRRVGSSIFSLWKLLISESRILYLNLKVYLSSHEFWFNS
jgi:hypothetical protein